VLRRTSTSVVTGSDLSGPSALAVDDEPMTTEPISMFLRDCGLVRLNTAENGEAILERLALRGVHLLACGLTSESGLTASTRCMQPAKAH
jgi:CheY-like chemotaxis protein